MFELLVAVAVGLVVGAVAALKVIAPKTETTKDDELLALLEKVVPYLPAGSQPAKEAKLLVAKLK